MPYILEHLHSIVSGLVFFARQKFRAFVVPRATQMSGEHACRDDVFLLRIIGQVLADWLIDVYQSLMY